MVISLRFFLHREDAPGFEFAAARTDCGVAREIEECGQMPVNFDGLSEDGGLVLWGIDEFTGSSETVGN